MYRKFKKGLSEQLNVVIIIFVISKRKFQWNFGFFSDLCLFFIQFVDFLSFSTRLSVSEEGSERKTKGRKLIQAFQSWPKNLEKFLVDVLREHCKTKVIEIPTTSSLKIIWKNKDIWLFWNRKSPNFSGKKKSFFFEIFFSFEKHWTVFSSNQINC